MNISFLLITLALLIIVFLFGWSERGWHERRLRSQRIQEIKQRRRRQHVERLLIDPTRRTARPRL